MSVRRRLPERPSGRQAEQPRQSPVKVDGQPRAAILIHNWHQHDRLHQRPQRVLRVLRPLRLGEPADKLPDAGPVGLRHAWMEPDRIRGRGRGQSPLQGLPASIELVQPVLVLVGRDPGDDRIDQLPVIGTDLSQFRLEACPPAFARTCSRFRSVVYSWQKISTASGSMR